MKKIIIGITVIVVTLFVLAYALLFTQPGNNLLRPTVEAKINNALKTNMTLEQFSLRPSYISVKLKTPMGSTFVAYGNFGLFSKNIDVKYALNVSPKENKFQFGKLKLKGPFWVKGEVKGSVNGLLDITGKSNFSSSDINYNIKLKNKRPSFLVVRINNLKLAELLKNINMPEFADASIKTDIEFTSFNKNALKGNGKIYITKGIVNGDVVKKEFNLNLPKTTFSAKADIVLNGSLVNLDSDIESNLGKSSIKGVFNQKTENINAKYVIKILNLALLKPLTNLELKGAFFTSGNIKGTKSVMLIKGTSNVADSQTNYNVRIKDSNIEKIGLYIKDAKLEKILAMLNKPIYAKGFVNANINLSDIKKDRLEGSIKANISKGVVNTAVVRKLFKLRMPETTFRADISSLIKKSVATSVVNVNSSIASLSTKKTVFNIPGFVLDTDYTLKIPDLNKLYFLTNRHMKGSSVVNGRVKYTKNGLNAIALSNMWGGKINVKINNDKVVGEAKNISVVKITDMMMYNRIFDSKGSVDFKYDMATKKGVVNALFVNGHILPNRVTFLLHNMAKFDITKEIYKTTKIHSTINNKKIFSNLDMVSRLTRISSKNAFIDMNRDTIDAKIRIAIKKNAVYVKLKGNLSHPRIKFDFRNLIKNKVEKKVKKKINSLLKNFIK